MTNSTSPDGMNQPKTLNPKDAAKEVNERGGWPQSYAHALQLGRDMDSAQWVAMLDEMRKLGLTKLADTLANEYTKNGTATVPTTKAAVDRIRSHSALPNTLWAAQEQIKMMSPDQKRQVVDALRKEGLTLIANSIMNPNTSAA